MARMAKVVARVEKAMERTAKVAVRIMVIVVKEEMVMVIKNQTEETDLNITVTKKQDGEMKVGMNLIGADGVLSQTPQVNPSRACLIQSGIAKVLGVILKWPQTVGGTQILDPYLVNNPELVKALQLDLAQALLQLAVTVRETKEFSWA